MQVYILTIDGKVQEESFTALKSLCKRYGLSYSSASRGKRRWLDDDGAKVVSRIKVTKLSARARNLSGKQATAAVTLVGPEIKLVKENGRWRQAGAKPNNE